MRELDPRVVCINCKLWERLELSTGINLAGVHSLQGFLQSRKRRSCKTWSLLHSLTSLYWKRYAMYLFYCVLITTISVLRGRGGGASLPPPPPPPPHFFPIIYKCCNHLLTISKVLEALEHPFLSMQFHWFRFKIGRDTHGEG